MMGRLRFIAPWEAAQGACKPLSKRVGFTPFAPREGTPLKKAAIILLAAAMLPAPSSAQTVDTCDRTPQVRDAIVAAAGAEDCAAVDSESLAGVTWLDISDQGLTSLRADDFDGLTSLQTLWLSGNQLAALPEGIFDGLTGLQYLFLFRNRLTALPEGAFDGLTGLQQLSLDSNQLAALPEGAFDGLTGLQELYLNNNRLAALPEGAFDGLTSLQRLELQGNQLAALPEGAFDGLTSLQFLYLYNNQLAALPEGAFDGLTSLQALFLGSNQWAANQLAALPEGAFDGLTSLNTLWLSGIQLAALPEGVFDGLTSLQELYLHYNQLAALPEGAFDGLTSLRVLYLHNNRLVALPEGVFDGLTSLQLLELGNNHLVGLTASDPLFAGLPSEVDLRLGRQTTAISVCDRTPQVRDAIMAADNAANCAAVGAARVTRLDIGRQGLTSLRADDFDGLTSLQELHLNNNQLSALPDGAFDGLTSLQVLRLDGNQLAALPDGAFDGLTSLQTLWLQGNQLAALPDGAFDGLTSLQWLALQENQLTELPEGIFDRLTSLQGLSLSGNGLAELPDGAFDSLTSLQLLYLDGNHLVGLTASDPLFAGLPSEVDLRLGGQATAISACDRTPQVRDAIMAADNAANCAAVGAARVTRLDIGGQGLTSLRADDFNGLTGLQVLLLHKNQLAALPEGIFDGLTSLQVLSLGGNRLAALPDGVFDGLTSLQALELNDNRLAALPDGVFDGLTSLHRLWLNDNRLAALPDGAFDGLTSLLGLYLHSNQLTELPEGAFDSLTSLQLLYLSSNQLAALPEGVFDGLTSLQLLYLNNNQLSALPEGAFDHLTSLQTLWLQSNDFVGLTLNDPLFAGLPDGVDVRLDTRLAAAVPFMPSASDSMRQGFVRIINESGASGGVRILAFDDGGNAANPIEIQLGAGQALHFNSGDLENGNANKGIEGVGPPAQGDWRLDVETALAVRVLSFVRTGDGFLTAMHDRLPIARPGQSRRAAWTFNPGSNDQSASSLRLVNTGGGAEGVSIEGVDDQGNAAGPVALTLAAGEARTLSALDLENGAQGLTGTLGDGAGKWRLFVTAGQPVVGASLLKAATGHVTNLSTAGVSATAAAVPFMPSASDSMRQGFVRIINESGASGGVRILAFDDGGNAANPIEIQLGAGQALHFNSGDLENGNANKGIEGVGPPAQGDWRLDVETALAVRVLSFVRTGDGFLTAMHDRLPIARPGQSRRAAWTFNPGSNDQSASSLRLVNTGGGAEGVSIEGVDDQGNAAGPVALTLAAGEARTLSALDLENGAQGLTGTLGDGAGKWRLFITAEENVVGASLLRAATGHATNLSTAGGET